MQRCAATPDTFAETRFTDPLYQAVNPFTPDYTRVGPEIHGNFIDQNSINGLFVRFANANGRCAGNHHHHRAAR